MPIGAPFSCECAIAAPRTDTAKTHKRASGQRHMAVFSRPVFCEYYRVWRVEPRNFHIGMTFDGMPLNRETTSSARAPSETLESPGPRRLRHTTAVPAT